MERLSGVCGEAIWGEAVERQSGGCVEAVWMVWGEFLESMGRLSEGCKKAVLRMWGGAIWKEWGG